MTGSSNMQTPVEIHHAMITNEMMESSAASSVGNMDFPEDVLTEDEKCALFFTLSHTVNETARWDEHIDDRYIQTVNIARGPTKPDSKLMQQTKKVNTTTSVQASFLKQNKSVKAQSVIQPVLPQPVVGRPLDSKPVVPQPVVPQSVRSSDSNDESVRVATDNNKSQRVKRQDRTRKRRYVER